MRTPRELHLLLARSKRVCDVITARVLTEAWPMLCQRLGPVYIYYTAASGALPGRLFAVLEDDKIPVGAQLVDPRRVPGNKTREQLAGWIDTFVRQLPILPEWPANHDDEPRDGCVCACVTCEALRTQEKTP